MKSQIISIFPLIATFCTIFAQLLPHSPDIILNELEHLYLDNSGPNSIKSTITPCTNYVDSTTGLNDNTLGRQSSAQWIRTAFRKTLYLQYLLQMLSDHAQIDFYLRKVHNHVFLLPYAPTFCYTFTSGYVYRTELRKKH